MTGEQKTFNIFDPCECMNMTRHINVTGQAINTFHAEGCEHYNPLAEAVEHIKRLVKGCESWAADEDGIHYECWDAYRSAVGFVDFQKALKLPANEV